MVWQTPVLMEMLSVAQEINVSVKVVTMMIMVTQHLEPVDKVSFLMSTRKAQRKLCC